MDNLTGADNIRKEMEEDMASGKLAKKKTMSVPEMRKLLGVKKTESYWLGHRNFFKTEIINGQMRVDLESFEKWYQNQTRYQLAEDRQERS